MTDPTLRCAQCAISLCADMTTLACPNCGRPLEVDYPGHDYSRAIPPMPVPGQFLDSATLGEGNTPIVDLPSVASQLGISLSMRQAGVHQPDRLLQGPWHGGRDSRGQAAWRIRGCGGLIGKRGRLRLCLRGTSRHEGPHLRSVFRPSGQAQADRRLRSAGTLHPRTT